MTKEQIFKLFKIEDLQDLSGAIMKILEGNINDRNVIYNQLLEFNDHDVSYDWFQNIYEDELAQRKQSKQDFTPGSVGLIASLITGIPKGKVYEPTAGNGSMIIADWWNRCKNSDFPLMHFPADNIVHCSELSARSLPILLLNLSIRGIMGYVYFGDVIEQKLKWKYVLLNRNNDTLAFSEIIKDERNTFFIEDQNGVSFKPSKIF